VSEPHYWFPKPYADFVQRLRVPCGFLLLVTFGLLSRPSAASVLIGLAVSIPGLLLRAWATGHLAKDQQLATYGPCAYVRNPLYAGTLIVAAGIVIASRDIWLAVIFAAFFLLVYLPTIELEEQHLRSKFPAYAAYAERVSRLVPLRRWPGEGKPFSWTLYKRNREDKALFGFLVAVAWLVFRCVWPFSWDAVIRLR
jgi:protein-S-isoprenylcysteine O-methyltransferase Ste14